MSAASGLVAVGRYVYVIADDELHLGVFPQRGRAPGTLVRLRPGRCRCARRTASGASPISKRSSRCRRSSGFPARRAAGARIRVAAQPAQGRARRARRAWRDRRPCRALVDLAPLYRAIAAAFDALNIEAAFVDGDHLALLQRGNKKDARNARIRLALPPLLEALAADTPLPASALLDITPFDLGSIAGVPLCFTDAAALPEGGFAFTAVAEDTDDSYADGACAGSAIGIVDRDDRS